MSKESNIEGLRALLTEAKTLLAKAEQNYANCGCKIYREEADALKVRIAQIEKEAVNG